MKRDLDITGYRCTACGRVHYPYHDRCLDCQGRDFTTLQPEGDPRLLTYTQIFNLPWGFDLRFLVIGVVAFENGIQAMGQIRVDSLEKLKLGMPLAASWEPVRQVSGEEVFGLVLRPA